MKRRIGAIHVLCLALLIIPLFGSITIGPYFKIADAEQAKEFYALIAILLISALSYIQQVNIIPKHNYFLYALILFLPISAYSAPPLRLMYGAGNVGNLWIWKATLWIILYFILYFFMPKPDWHSKKVIAKTIGWAAILSCGYAYLQALGWDQFQFERSYYHIGSPKAANITAAVGNSTFLGVWLVLCLPFIWTYFKRRWTFFVVGVVILSQSDFARAGLIFLAFFGLWLRSGWKIRLGMTLSLIILVFTIFATHPKMRTYVWWENKSNGRLQVWKKVWQDWPGPPIKIPILSTMTRDQIIEIQNLNKRNYAFTGRGAGSFPYIYGISKSSKWESPHNVYLLSLYCIGLIGTVLFLLSVGRLLWRVPPDPFYLACCASLAFCCFAAIGIPFLNNEVLRFYGVAVAALLAKSK